jgi:UDP-N-acetylglucosamine--N-acetylmuramyl-(pentapeptide) pyrophosphoryl-undecaprenol N-acetylglucosamine transferase
MGKKIIFSTGGTGGHIIPTINVMDHLLNKGYEVLLITDDRGYHYCKDHKEFKLYILKSETLTNKNFLQKFLSIFIIMKSVIKSVFILKKEKPDLVFGLGGYVSFPVSFASFFFNIPLIIYENNIVLGRANKILSILSKKILIAKKEMINFPKKYIKKTHTVGPILGKNIINYSNKENKNNKNYFSILVLGGSQGAKIFGNIIPSVIKKIKDEGHEIEIIQQCVMEQKKSLVDFYDRNKIKNYVFHFEKNVLQLILSSDLAITRCGASTTAELVYTQTPFIAVPLPDSIDNHQYLNAKHYESMGCCFLLKQEHFKEENLFNLITKNIKNKNQLDDIRENMKKNSNKNVYIDIENQIKEFI